MTLEPCVNLRTLGHRITGVQRYLLNLLRHMPAELHRLRPTHALQGMKGHLWEQVYLPTQLRHRLLWSPGNTGPISVSRQVLTVHDAASLDHPEWFERKFATWYGTLLPHLIRKVRAVITVSRFSKERIVQITGVEPERIHVISNGVDHRFRPVDPDRINQMRKELDLSGPYILFVGSLEPRKNLKTLLRAWRLGAFDGATLVVAGGRSDLFAKLQLEAPPVASVRWLGPVEDEVLPVLYSGAAGFIYPSIYEGFGLPPLEAMACGCAVAVSEIPPHREICGGTATYFDPLDPEDISAKLEYLLRLDSTSRALLAQQGIRRAVCYSWESAASETWCILTLARTGRVCVADGDRAARA